MKWYTVSQLAKKLDLTPSNLYYHIQHGHLKARTRYGKKVVPGNAVEEFLESGYTLKKSEDIQESDKKDMVSDKTPVARSG